VRVLVFTLLFALLISFGYSLGLGTFEVLRRVCPVPPVVKFDPDSLEKRIFCPKCPPFTTDVRMRLSSNGTADFVVEYTLKVGNLWLAVYHSSECEPHSEGYGGYIVFNEKGRLLRAESGYPGLCQNLSTDDILCLNHFLAQGILNTRISHCRINSKYKLSCKDIFVATDDTGFEEKGTVQYITKLYVKDKDHFYFRVNQQGKIYTVDCKRNGDIFNCKGLKKLKRRVP
jgi:hypothetical protein